MMWCTLPGFYSCNICGWGISGIPDGTSWRSQFRAVYLDETETETEARLSGLGLYYIISRPVWIAPIDPEARWDQTGYENRSELRVEEFQQIDLSNRKTFFFHGACWSLLQKAMNPVSIPLQRLFDVCNSTPFPDGALSIRWGHDYGGLFMKDDRNFFPWEDRIVSRRFDPSLGFPFAAQPFEHDPYDIRQAKGILSESQKMYQGLDEGISLEIYPREIQRYSPSPRVVAVDCFDKMPYEIRSLILQHMKARDALDLRLATRAFEFVLEDQCLWAFRFSTPERSWFFEAGMIHGQTDWKDLFRRTRHTSLGKGLRNRKRIWTTLGPIVNSLLLEKQEPGGALPETYQHWITVSGEIQQPSSTQALDKSRDGWFQEGCRVFFRQRVLISEAIQRIIVYRVSLGDSAYVVGFEMVGVNGESVRAGYRSESFATAPLNGLRGFKVSLGSRGIHAVRCIDSTGGMSLWLGDPSEGLITNRLADFGDQRILEVGFDGCKMVSLAMPMADTSGLGQIRRSGLWYPEIPGEFLRLHQQSSTLTERYASGFKPLVWTHFGGAKGELLRSLSNIRGFFKNGYLVSLRFDYTNSIRNQTQYFGRGQEESTCSIVYFSIDGPGGELIEEIEVFYSSQSANGDSSSDSQDFKDCPKLRSIKIGTNFERSCYFAEKPDVSEYLISTKVYAPPNMSITALYGGHEPGTGIVALGAMTEATSGAIRSR